jgi:RNA polymerase sigma-70 factor (ECF subfamily)
MSGDREEDERRWAAWMVAAQAGDEDAYRRLLSELGRAVDRYVRRHFGAGEFVEDCVQEILLAVHQARHSWDPARSFRPWLFTIVKHKAIDFLRRRNVRTRYEASDVDPDVADRGVPPTAESKILAGELVEKLDRTYRDALLMTKLEGRSVAEVAARLGVSEAAVKTRVHRAIKALQRALRSENP